MDLATSRKRLLRLVPKSRLFVSSYLLAMNQLTLFIIKDDTSLIVHDVTAPDEVYC
jgi:hypothetical protein